jgi:hypothetical protein
MNAATCFAGIHERSHCVAIIEYLDAEQKCQIFEAVAGGSLSEPILVYLI